MQTLAVSSELEKNKLSVFGVLCDSVFNYQVRAHTDGQYSDIYCNLLRKLMWLTESGFLMFNSGNMIRTSVKISEHTDI